MTQHQLDRRAVDMAKLHALEEQARGIGRLIGDAIKKNPALGRNFGFALMMFSYEGPEFTWISTAQREDMIKVLDEFRERLIAKTADELSRPKGRG